MEQKDILFLKIIAVIFLLLLALSLTGDVFRRQVADYHRKEEAKKNQGALEYNNEILGVNFRYPGSWGELKYEEIIGINYLFQVAAPDSLGEIFAKKGLGK